MPAVKIRFLVSHSHVHPRPTVLSFCCVLSSILLITQRQWLRWSPVVLSRRTRLITSRCLDYSLSLGLNALRDPETFSSMIRSHNPDLICFSGNRGVPRRRAEGCGCYGDLMEAMELRHVLHPIIHDRNRHNNLLKTPDRVSADMNKLNLRPF